MAFQFRLEKILHFVRLKETVKKMELSASTQRTNFIKKRIDELSTGLQDMLGKFHAQTSSEWVHYHTTKITFDAKEVTKLEKVLANEMKAMERLKRELDRIFRKKKALEALKQKRHQDYQVQESRRRQKVLDDAHQMSRGRERE